MKANELRIGNLISHDRCDKFRIDEVRLTNEGYILRMYVHRNTLTSYADMKLDEAKPIPLTLELLKKCGFTDNDYKAGYIGIDIKDGGMITDFVLTKPEILGEFQKHFCWQYNTGGIPFFLEIKYLHDLQNLFFTLKNEELEINLNEYDNI